MSKKSPQPLIMEVTVISAEGLKNTSSALFSRRLRTFVTVSVPPPSCKPSSDGDKLSHVYTTRVDDQGGINPNWGDKFRLPIDATFLCERQSFIYLQLFSKLLVRGQTQLGWCQIPAADILDGISPAGSVRHLSYRLRGRDGSRTHGVVNIAVKLEGSPLLTCPQRPSNSNLTEFPEMGLCQTVIGIPVAISPGVGWCA